MSEQLKEGVTIKFIRTPPLGEFLEHAAWQTGDHGNCKSITVTMEMGPMDWMPWARCERNDGRVEMVNLVYVETLELA